MVTNQLIAGDCRMLCESIAPMKPATAKVSGNQGRMVGRRLAVGFLHIVPGVFPTGVVTDRLQRDKDGALP
ncbi:hypothetical protein [Oligosphaera ethanolica]|uniref:Uncharacterized protein n=1 Tax=Oligosphaera ethanolica TaxID=760260 RepID=A0AAE3VHY1_9BACT|nr:hypothetical protein [Oligosphaera ethanolica]MDQ0290633.1 hypothetical protein [Oligosphaera ethanolica]